MVKCVLTIDSPSHSPDLRADEINFCGGRSVQMAATLSRTLAAGADKSPLSRPVTRHRLSATSGVIYPVDSGSV